MNPLDQLPPETGESPPTLSELLDRRPFADSEALVESDDGPLSPVDAAELSAWCREHLAPYKVPAGFTRIEALPRSDIGKMLRRELSAHGPATSQEDR